MTIPCWISRLRNMKTSSKFIVTKSFKEYKEYGKITFPNMSTGVDSFVFII